MYNFITYCLFFFWTLVVFSFLFLCVFFINTFLPFNTRESMDRPRNIYKHKVKNINESKKPVKREANGGQGNDVKCVSGIKNLSKLN